MKKLFAVFFILVVSALIVLFGIFSNLQSNNNTNYLRIHIRANSNKIEDQNVKYEIKESIVEFLTPLISNCENKKDFIDILFKNLYQIECISNEILAQNNFDYKASVKINNEFFPTRSYDNLTLKDGFYDALIVKLGEGNGNNWWCVVYPPLCFLNNEMGYVYKSRIIELINNFFGG